MADSEDILTNPTFTWGSYHGWKPHGCSLSIGGESPEFHCIAHNRTVAWHGIYQDITHRLKAGMEYKVEACMKIAGPVERAGVQATLKLEYAGVRHKCVPLASGLGSKFGWALLEGKMEVSILPLRALVYLEGPPPGVDLLAKSFSITPLRPEPENSGKELEEKEDLEGNVLVNPTFDSGVQGWTGFCCKILHSGQHGLTGITGPRGTAFAIALDRKEWWQGIEQDITDLVEPNKTYVVKAVVSTAGRCHKGMNVVAQVLLHPLNSRYITVARAKVSNREWTTLEGNFRLETRPHGAALKLEGPRGGVDILVASVTIKPVTIKRNNQQKAQRVLK